jgi:hypothetical protein
LLLLLHQKLLPRAAGSFPVLSGLGIKLNKASIEPVIRELVQLRSELLKKNSNSDIFKFRKFQSSEFQLVCVPITKNIKEFKRGILNQDGWLMQVLEAATADGISAETFYGLLMVSVGFMVTLEELKQ